MKDVCNSIKTMRKEDNDMDIIVTNLGVISQGKLSIEKDIVNIKYGINGSGKSTISKGLELFINNDDLGELKPFGIVY